jgi:hypothetical protein
MRNYRKVFKESSSIGLDELKSELAQLLGISPRETFEANVFSRPSGTLKGIGINLKGRYYISFFDNYITFLDADDKQSSFYLYPSFTYFLETQGREVVIQNGGITITIYL